MVTHGGGKQLEEPAVVRPTSETIVNSSFARWISSYRDLPLLINQWANVVRWELRPRLLLRTFGVSLAGGAHRPCHVVRTRMRTRSGSSTRSTRTRWSRSWRSRSFAAARPNGRSSRAPRSPGHAKASCATGRRSRWAPRTSWDRTSRGHSASSSAIVTVRLRHVWQTSWGVSTRLLGAMIMVHGDDHGLRVPPRLAPIEVVVVVARAGEGVIEAATTVVDRTRARGSACRARRPCRRLARATDHRPRASRCPGSCRARSARRGR